jgi:hypothetical protein
MVFLQHLDKQILLVLLGHLGKFTALIFYQLKEDCLLLVFYHHKLLDRTVGVYPYRLGRKSCKEN